MAKIILPAKDPDSIFSDMRGRHVAVRTPSLEEAKDFYVGKLDFRVVAEWPYGDESLAYLAPANDDDFYIEVLGGGKPAPVEGRPYAGVMESLNYRGYHHFCLHVSNVEETVEKLRARGVTIANEPTLMEAINCKLAFFSDPFGNLIELAEVLS